jgi:putative ABC transport system permease protein
MRGDRIALALRMVVRRPVRSVLAALGLAITLGAVLAAVAIAERAKTSALADIRRMGANVLTVSAEASRNRGGRARTTSVVTTLTLVDAREIEQTVVGIVRVAAEYRSVVPVRVGDLARQAAVAGIEPSYGTLREASMRSGRFFDAADDVQGQRVAVLGARIANDLFAGIDPTGNVVRLRGVPFFVLGVFTERGTGLDAFDEDEAIFIPLKAARRRLFPVDYVDRLFVRTDESADLGQVATAIVGALRARHHVIGQEPLDFRVQDQRRLVTLKETAVERLGAFQVEVSGALLFAGALGVFALQWLSVRERRGEIGARRAVGATRGMIFRQFLLEAAVICVTGSTVGIALGLAAAAAAHVSVASGLAAAAFAVSVGAGMAASGIPARAAAALHPAIALRAQ